MTRNFIYAFLASTIIIIIKSSFNVGYIITHTEKFT